MKAIILAASAFVGVMGYCIGIYWLGGGEFERGEALVWMTIMGTLFGGLAAVATSDILR